MRHSLRCLVAVAAIASAWPVPLRAQSESRSADAILKDLDALERPKPPGDLAKDREAMSAYSKSLLEYENRRSKATAELFAAHPEHPRVPALLRERWASPYILVSSRPEDLVKEADTALAKIDDPRVRIDALFLKARVVTSREMPGVEFDPLAAVDAFAKAAPKDARAAGLLYSLAYREKDQARKITIEDRILADYPDSPVVARIQGVRKQRESIGKPFELEFTDAIKGDTVSIKGLAGKVVVVDFWATWCGPCIAEMPRMKKLYAQYHDKGVEFIGVSLDRSEADGGLEKLKGFVAKNEIPWPQYYQGNYWQSEFSSSWGIRAIPALFVVDQEGKLHSVEARAVLETMIPELLARNAATRND